MTKSQFLEECDSLDYCYDFLCENDIYTISNRFFSQDSYDEEIASIIEDWNPRDWEQLGVFLYNLPTGYYFYWKNDYDEFEGMSDRND